jgi:hypothetical protein
MKRVLALVLVVALVVPTPTFAVFGVADTGDGILSSILVQNVQETINTTSQLAQLKEMLTTARESYEFVRSTYAVAQDLQGFDASRFLQQSRDQFLATTPGINEARGLANDIATQGIRGGRGNLWALQGNIDVFKDRVRAEKCCCNREGFAPANAPTECPFVCSRAVQAGWPYNGNAPACAPPERARCSCGPFGPMGGSPSGCEAYCPIPPRMYDPDAARQLGLALDSLMADEALRTRFLSNANDPNLTDALLYSELSAQDPTAAQALLRERTASSQAAATARKDWDYTQKNRDMNVGTASAITARSSSLAAEQLAAIRDAQARQLALQQQAASREAQAQRKEDAAAQVRILRMGEVIFIATRSLGLSSAPSSSASADPYAP